MTPHAERASDDVRTAGDGEGIVEQVRQRYGQIAEGRVSGCCGPQPAGCGSGESAAALGIGYDAKQLEAVPEGANLGLGCGAPIDFLDLKPGEIALDLGSGAGVDVFLAARKVGPAGRAIGVDMTPQMLERARANARKAAVTNVEFREGRLEALPVEDASVDAVTSNCVINLVPDKGAVFREVARVLKPGGRLVISDIILDGRLPQALEKDILAHVGCIAGAMERAEYFGRLEAAGLSGVEVLKDVDYLGALASAVPDQAHALLVQAGVALEDVSGKVRSVTFRALKPSRPAKQAACCGPTCCH
jgi:SAM-dependent methyltransferase